MQEEESMERVEHVFANALVQTYQQDGLLDLYHALRSIWQKVVQPSDRESYRSKLYYAFQEIKSVSLWSQQHRLLTVEEVAIVREIEYQFAQLEEQEHFQ